MHSNRGQITAVKFLGHKYELIASIDNGTVPTLFLTEW